MLCGRDVAKLHGEILHGARSLILKEILCFASTHPDLDTIYCGFSKQNSSR
jgi:hypothetical protein